MTLRACCRVEALGRRRHVAATGRTARATQPMSLAPGRGPAAAAVAGGDAGRHHCHIDLESTGGVAVWPLLDAAHAWCCSAHRRNTVGRQSAKDITFEQGLHCAKACCEEPIGRGSAARRTRVLRLLLGQTRPAANQVGHWSRQHPSSELSSPREVASKRLMPISGRDDKRREQLEQAACQCRARHRAASGPDRHRNGHRVRLAAVSLAVALHMHRSNTDPGTSGRVGTQQERDNGTQAGRSRGVFT